ncbi:MAG TPA: hypothetical protein VMU57_02785 [Edaphobacter sp.]|uniref:glycosyltransferase domain-containing protein n=1 Tax=Edaphobacter sp. TaxID=1934404 RepID=UPI002BF8708A|nr:hypothetical protein [Edaphobacter sp.]HUZ93816.1 hypothetical protein [Edaphobacter sp.]
MYGLGYDGFILHCPGPQRLHPNPFRRHWAKACRNFFKDKTLCGRFTDPANLTIITYNTRPEEELLERCLRHLGLKEFVVLGRELKAWNWLSKISLVYDYLESGACNTDYIVCLDGDDVLIVSDPNLILKRFHEAKCKVLFCNTRGNQPPSQECWDFENSVAMEHDLYHRHLNAGGYVGRRAYVHECLKEILDHAHLESPWCISPFGFDDQLAWRHLHRRYYPDIKVDVRCNLFVRFDEDR